MSEELQLFDRGLLRRRARALRARWRSTNSCSTTWRLRSPTVSGRSCATFRVALDLGAYDGVLGRAVSALPSVGQMIYAESVPALATLCPRPCVVCDEELLPFRDASFNLVVSGLALHRVNDLPGALIQIRRALCPDGLFIGAALGSRSLQELRNALIEAEAEQQGGASPHIAPFADVREYGGLLQRAGFALPVSDTEVLNVIYPAPRDLMREIRAIGGGNVLAARRKRRCHAGRSSAPKRSTGRVTARQMAGSWRASRSSIWAEGAPCEPAKACGAGSATRGSPKRFGPRSMRRATRPLSQQIAKPKAKADLGKRQRSRKIALSGSSAGGMA